MALSENPTLEEIIDEAERLNNLVIDRGGIRTITPSPTNQVLSKGNYKGDITILGDSDLIAINIKSGANVFGVSGSVRERNYATGVVTTESISTPLDGVGGMVKIYNLGFVPSLVIMYPKYNFVGAGYRLTFAGSFIRESTPYQYNDYLADIVLFSPTSSATRNYSYKYNQTDPISKITKNEIVLPASLPSGYEYTYIAIE